MLLWLKTTNSWPLRLRLAVAAAALFGAYLFQIPLETVAPGEPFLLFLVVVIGCAVVFGRTVAFLALGASTLLSTHFFEPGLSLQISRAGDLITVELYAILGTVAVMMLTSLMDAILDSYETTRALAEADKHKTLLLREMAHRVANNFASVATLINRKAASIADPNARSALGEASKQVNVMARIHTCLTPDEDGLSVESRDFLLGLCQDLRLTLPSPHAVSIECSAINTAIQFTQAVSLGLIANELVTNAVKHAFPEGRQGLVRVALEHRGERLCLSVADNGNGVGGQTKGSGLGRQLTAALAEHLGGEIKTITSKEGMKIEVTFVPLRQPARATRSLAQAPFLH